MGVWVLTYPNFTGTEPLEWQGNHLSTKSGTHWGPCKHLQTCVTSFAKRPIFGVVKMQDDRYNLNSGLEKLFICRSCLEKSVARDLHLVTFRTLVKESRGHQDESRTVFNRLHGYGTLIIILKLKV